MPLGKKPLQTTLIYLPPLLHSLPELILQCKEEVDPALSRVLEMSQQHNQSHLLEETGTHICAFGWASQWTWVRQRAPSAVSLSLKETRGSFHPSHYRRAAQQPNSRANGKGKWNLSHIWFCCTSALQDCITQKALLLKHRISNLFMWHRKEKRR